MIAIQQETVIHNYDFDDETLMPSLYKASLIMEESVVSYVDVLSGLRPARHIVQTAAEHSSRMAPVLF